MINLKTLFLFQLYNMTGWIPLHVSTKEMFHNRLNEEAVMGSQMSSIKLDTKESWIIVKQSHS